LGLGLLSLLGADLDEAVGVHVWGFLRRFAGLFGAGGKCGEFGGGEDVGGI